MLLPPALAWFWVCRLPDCRHYISGVPYSSYGAPNLLLGCPWEPCLLPVGGTTGYAACLHAALYACLEHLHVISGCRHLVDARLEQRVEPSGAGRWTQTDSLGYRGNASAAALALGQRWVFWINLVPPRFSALPVGSDSCCQQPHSTLYLLMNMDN